MITVQVLEAKSNKLFPSFAINSVIAQSGNLTLDTESIRIYCFNSKYGVNRGPSQYSIYFDDPRLFILNPVMNWMWEWKVELFALKELYS